MNHPPYFKFYPNDFLTSYDVSQLSVTQVGVYMLLISHCWANGNRLPSNVRYLRKIGRCPSRVPIEPVLSLFYACSNDTLLYHPKLEKQLESFTQRQKKMSEGGRIGGLKSQATLKHTDQRREDKTTPDALARACEVTLKKLGSSPLQIKAIMTAAADTGRSKDLFEELRLIHLNDSIKNKGGYIFKKYAQNGQ